MKPWNSKRRLKLSKFLFDRYGEINILIVGVRSI